MEENDFRAMAVKIMGKVKILAEPDIVVSFETTGAGKKIPAQVEVQID
jgi:hypothetical protein